MGDLPKPDLCIRTGGEYRISNFLLWQLAYAELFFSECFWPDFGEQQIDHAVAEYATRQRRYGMTSEQVSSETTTTESQSANTAATKTVHEDKRAAARGGDAC